jgi:hypothetical protein
MFGYLIALAIALLLTRWVFYTLRPTAKPSEIGPGDTVMPGSLRTIAKLTGPNFEEDQGDAPQSMGEPLARAICEGLRSRGYTHEEPYASSHGYEFDVLLHGVRYTVSCGLLAAEDDDTNEWLVFVKRSHSAHGKPQPAQNTANARELMASLHELFGSLPGLKRQRWHADDQAFARGDEHWHMAPY